MRTSTLQIARSVLWSGNIRSEQEENDQLASVSRQNPFVAALTQNIELELCSERGNTPDLGSRSALQLYDRRRLLEEWDQSGVLRLVGGFHQGFQFSWQTGRMMGIPVRSISFEQHIFNYPMSYWVNIYPKTQDVSWTSFFRWMFVCVYISAVNRILLQNCTHQFGMVQFTEVQIFRTHTQFPK